MKDIDKQDPHDVSGGYQPSDGGCFPPSIDYPYFPLVPDPVPSPDPLPGFHPIA